MGPPTLTLAEAAAWLDPPLTPGQLHAIIKALGIVPAGSRPNGGPGRPQATYHAATLMRLHAAIIPFLHDSRDVHPGVTD